MPINTKPKLLNIRATFKRRFPAVCILRMAMKDPPSTYVAYFGCSRPSKNTPLQLFLNKSFH